MRSLGKHFVEDSHGCGGLPRLCPQRNVLTVRWPSSRSQLAIVRTHEGKKRSLCRFLRLRGQKEWVIA